MWLGQACRPLADLAPGRLLSTDLGARERVEKERVAGSTARADKDL
jgi:hypothetical protein